MTAIENRVSEIKTNDLIDMAEALVKKQSQDADMVLQVVLEVLMERMDSDKFVALCAQIEELM